jgi:hypothetical protein
MKVGCKGFGVLVLVLAHCSGAGSTATDAPVPPFADGPAVVPNGAADGGGGQALRVDAAMDTLVDRERPEAAGSPSDAACEAPLADVPAEVGCRRGDTSCRCTTVGDCAAADDANPCNGVLVCRSGTCVVDPATIVVCDATQDDECNANTCEPATGVCAHKPRADGTSCASGLVCRTAERCVAGVCAGGSPKPCGSACDVCDESSGGCVLAPGYCRISGACVVSGATEPGRPCSLCDPATPDRWSAAREGTSCSPGKPCALGGTCDATATCKGVYPIPPGKPMPWYPRNGALTGSLFARKAAMTLRPLLRWYGVGTDACAITPTYDVEVDDSCDPATFDTCSFPSPEASARLVDGTSWRPPAELPVSTVRPVGRRYFWRVRACREDSCTAWSPVQYLDVGRTPKDLDGDGYGDAIVGASSDAAARGHVFVFFGSAAGPSSTPSITLAEPEPARSGQFGRSIATGDLNGDGYADLMVCDSDGSWMGASRVLIYYGGVSGVATTPQTVLRSPVAYPDAPFDYPIASGNDLDADGYADLIVPAVQGGDNPPSAYVFLGGAGQVGPDASYVIPTFGNYNFARAMAFDGDINADGITDLVFSHAANSSFYDNLVTFLGARRTQPRKTTELPSRVAVHTVIGMRPIVASGDLSGDGTTDVALSGFIDVGNTPTIDPVLGFWGSSNGLKDPSSFALTPPNPGFGNSIAVADVDGDGRAELVVGAPGDFWNGIPGLIYVYPPPLSSSSYPSVVDAGATVKAFGSVVEPLDLNGDGYDDVLASAPREGGEGAVFVLLGSSAGLPSLATRVIPHPLHLSGGMFGDQLAH